MEIKAPVLDLPSSQPVVTSPEPVAEVVAPTPKPFKLKRAWLTEAANDLLLKRIHEEETKPLTIEPLAHRKISRKILGNDHSKFI